MSLLKGVTISLSNCLSVKLHLVLPSKGVLGRPLAKEDVCSDRNLSNGLGQFLIDDTEKLRRYNRSGNLGFSIYLVHILCMTDGTIYRGEK